MTDMNIDSLKQRLLEFIADIQNRYWPSAVHYIENNSPSKLFVRALLIGLILSIPWQCSRLLFNKSVTDDPEKKQVESTSFMLPNFNSGSVTNMPNPKARRPAPAPITTNTAPEEPTQTEIVPTNNPKVESDKDAMIVSQTPPEYPSSALRKQESGTVVVRVTIDANGEVKDTAIETSSTSRTLDRAARKSVSKWKFSPKIENGVAVTSDLLIPVEYKSE